MDNNRIVLRPANPTFKEGLLYAHYLDQAAEGFFRIMFGPRFAEIIARAYTEPGHDLSYEHATFAEKDEIIVGMVSGFTAEQHRRSSDRPLKDAAGFRIVRLMLVRTLFAPMWRVLDTLADGDFYLQAIAVDKKRRGEGIGSILIDFIEQRAVACGSKRLALDVSGGNKGARKLYERRGMTVESRWPKRLKIPGLKLLRMTKSL